MSRSAHAITAADNRMTRDAEKAKEAALDVLMHQSAQSVVSGALGGLTDARATKMALALADRALDAHALLTDGPCSAAWCGKKAGQLCDDIPAPKASKRAAADRLFARAGGGGE